MSNVPVSAEGHTTPRSRVQRTRMLAKARIRTGWSRVKVSWWPILQAAAAAGLAYWFSGEVLGHANPLFAPIAAWMTLGFTADRELRRMLELGLGVALGVGLGDLVVHLIGSGVAQLSVVLFVAALIARFLDRGILFTTQAGVQALVVVALPPEGYGGPLGRWTDALTGVGIAIIVSLLTPGDPRRKARIEANEALHTVAEVIRHTSLAIRFFDREEIALATAIGRKATTTLEDWHSITRNAREFARISPAQTQIEPELAVLERAAERTATAMRTARTLARRANDLVNHRIFAASLADLLDDLAEATEQFGNDLGAGQDPAVARVRLATVANRADPYSLGRDEWLVQGLVVLVRSLVVDLQEAAGASETESRDALPEI